MELRYPDPDLRDGFVRLRPWSDGDLDCVRRAADDSRIPSDTTVPAVFTTSAALAFVHRQRQRIERGEGIALVIANASDDAVGQLWMAVRPQPGVMGLGYWVIPQARNHGSGTRAVCLATDWMLTSAGAARVEAWVEPHNVASQRLLISAGFTREGVLRSFLYDGSRNVDAIVLSRTAADALR